tara:strand:- start:224 stop:535 length:312 start_codon:yes stop_codon:yes gene_type:complete
MKQILFILSILSFIAFNKTFVDEKFNIGKEIFLNAGNCATCHSLKDAGSVANVGPNLNEIRPDIGRVIISVTNGAGVMPSYLGILSQDEIEAVSYYVSEASMN